MRNDPSPLSPYLNAGVVILGILLGIWAKHDQGAAAPAMKPADGTRPCCDRLDQASARRDAVFPSL